MHIDNKLTNQYKGTEKNRANRIRFTLSIYENIKLFNHILDFSSKIFLLLLDAFASFVTNETGKFNFRT